MNNLHMTAAAEEWLHNTALLEVGNTEFAELLRIYGKLRDSSSPVALLRELEDAVAAYAVCFAEASFLAGIKLARDPMGYLVHGKPWAEPDRATGDLAGG